MHSDGVEVCEDSELCRLHGQREYDWRCKAIPENTAFDAGRLFAEPDHRATILAPSLPPVRAANICLETHCKSREYRVDVSQGNRIQLTTKKIT